MFKIYDIEVIKDYEESVEELIPQMKYSVSFLIKADAIEYAYYSFHRINSLNIPKTFVVNSMVIDIAFYRYYFENN